MNNIEKQMDKYKCNVCNKLYSSYKSLWNHNKEFHKNNNINVNIFKVATNYRTNSYMWLVNNDELNQVKILCFFVQK